MRTSSIIQTNVEPESTSPGLLREACRELGLPFHGVSVAPGAPRLPELPDARTLTFDEWLAADYEPSTPLFVRPYVSAFQEGA